MHEARRKTEPVEAVETAHPESSDALWDDLIGKVSTPDGPQQAEDSFSQIVQEVEIIKDPSQLREFKKNIEQAGPGQ